MKLYIRLLRGGMETLNDMKLQANEQGTDSLLSFASEVPLPTVHDSKNLIALTSQPTASSQSYSTIRLRAPSPY